MPRPAITAPPTAKTGPLQAIGPVAVMPRGRHTKPVRRDDAAEGATAAGQRISWYGYRQVRSEPEIGQWPEFE